MGDSKGSIELKFTKGSRFTEFGVCSTNTTEIIPWLYTVLPPSRKRKMTRDSSHRLSDFESWDVVDDLLVLLILYWYPNISVGM